MGREALDTQNKMKSEKIISEKENYVMKCMTKYNETCVQRQNWTILRKMKQIIQI